MEKMVKIKWVKSTIGRSYKQKRTIRALGFKRLNQEITKELTPQIEGMIKKVSHLVRVEEL
ncbi:MAG TPA: 50S ribosomal protein L30 [Candidatus Atribacteria bacterium]|nr:50S ribosomal protein L30 [Candidatus Atribacteria bacterium]